MSIIPQHVETLKAMGACPPAIKWASRYPDLQSAYDACDRGDRMLWYVARAGTDRRRLTLAACECARLALPHVPDGEDRPRIAIETAEAWARGEDVTLREVRDAAAHADAAYAAYAAIHGFAAAAYAALAAGAAADVAVRRYAAVYPAAEAAGAAGASLRQCADIVRRHYPSPPSD